jgi:hypothetical protein
VKDPQGPVQTEHNRNQRHTRIRFSQHHRSRNIGILVLVWLRAPGGLSPVETKSGMAPERTRLLRRVCREYDDSIKRCLTSCYLAYMRNRHCDATAAASRLNEYAKDSSPHGNDIVQLHRVTLRAYTIRYLEIDERTNRLSFIRRLPSCTALYPSTDWTDQHVGSRVVHRGLDRPRRPANRHPDRGLSTASDNGRDNANLKRSTNEHTDNCNFFFMS